MKRFAILFAVAAIIPATRVRCNPVWLPRKPCGLMLNRNCFHLPPGFEIQLVVSDPDIGKPMNLNFDARGRLWITLSIEYPWPAKGVVEPRSRFSRPGGSRTRAIV
jgi:hypothetical protein